MALKPEDEENIKACQMFRDQIRQELNHRRLSSRAYNFKDITTENLEKDLQWYIDRIDAILKPYEDNLP